MSRSPARSLTRHVEMQAVVAEAFDDGWSGELRRGGHIRFTHPEVPTPVFAPSTPSDYRSCKNTRAQLRRALRPHQPVPQEDTMTKTTNGTTIDAWVCSACQGRGEREAFLTEQLLADHIVEKHSTTSSTNGKFPSMEAFEEFCWEREEQTFTIDDVIEHFGIDSTREARKKIANRVGAMSRRTASHGTMEQIARGKYRFTLDDEARDEAKQEQSTASVDEPEVGPPVEQAPVSTPVEKAPVSTPVEKAPRIRLFEWVADTTDGRTIVKDDQGKVYFATLREL